ncbi:Selenoprotein Pa [Collichthys lucidus]|uniref:Selenoprotein Pa n=1 Tax=Collichthys lucidus TaxID=240159 RepID=A0A4U5UU94_COLLU|nr:Selenoprotein Pa [Collichthys lucidus]
MWACLSLLITLCLLHGGGAESDGGGPRCQLPPAWKIGEVDPMNGAMGKKLESQGLRDVVYMVVNHQGEQSQRLHTLLAQRLTEPITLYKQGEQQPDVWQTLGGEKDDFFIYDRCGRLTHRISLPYSIIGQGHVESAIKDTYCKRICGECTHERKTLEMLTIMDITMAMDMATMGLIMAMITTMVITMEIMVAMTVSMDRVKVSKVSVTRAISKMYLKYLKII